MHWKDDHVVKIYDQIRKLGASYDWSRARFTMDPVYLEISHDLGNVRCCN